MSWAKRQLDEAICRQYPEPPEQPVRNIYAEVKAAQEKALADFAYYTGILTHAGGCANEHLAPQLELPDHKDSERLSPIWQKGLELGYERDKNGWDA